MARGENIFKRKDGRWEARYVKERRLSGKIKYGYCYGKSYKEAKAKAERCKAAVLAGQPCPAERERHCLSFCCDEGLRSGKSRVKESTYVKYDGILKRHIKPELGDCLPAAVTEGIIEDFRDRLLYEKGLSPKTVKDILVVLRSVLNDAAKHSSGSLPRFEIAYPKDIKKEMRVLSAEEQKCLTVYLLTEMDACKFGVLLALSTGMRIGEVCALRWKNVSVKDGTVKVDATMQRLEDTEGGSAKTKITVSAPKSEASVRLIPMTESLTALCREMDPHDPTAYLLTGTADFMEPRTLQYRLKKYTADCGLEGVHFHTLRHTFATRCVEVGFEMKSLSEILGHSDTTITLNRYVHSSMELKRSNMNKLNAAGF